MNRKAIAQETLKIQQQGYYEIDGFKIDIAEQQRLSEQNSFLLTPEEGAYLVGCQKPPETGPFAVYSVSRQSVVDAILDMHRCGFHPAVLNFASAKNPGGGFLNGAIAQEEALAASSGLYRSLIRHETYYSVNQAFRKMIYTDHAIYSPDVVFFRNSEFDLLNIPVTASVLTLPAVNMGQVILKGEDVNNAKAVMKNRMRLALAIFAKQQNRHLILGAYGCGVFRNDPEDVARWWKELLEDEGYGRFFEQVVFAILGHSKTSNNLAAFENVFGFGRNNQ